MRVPKKIASLMTGFAVALIGVEGQAAEPTWTVQVDPLTTALGFVHVQVEHAFTPDVSVYLGPSLRLFGSPLLDAQDEDFLGIGAEAGVRWYVTGSAPRGWWVMGRGVLAGLSADVDGESLSAIGGYGSVLGGYTWLLMSDRLVLSAGLGGQYLSYQIADMGPRGFLPAAHTTIGFAF